jgi:TPR repeat protein
VRIAAFLVAAALLSAGRVAHAQEHVAAPPSVPLSGRIQDPAALQALQSAKERGDFVAAVQILTPLANQGNAQAQFNLGEMYAEGHGVPQDYAQAVGWFQKAADQGYPAAQYNLAASYYNGEGVARDPVKAVEWSRKAADQGVAMAQFGLARAYYSGEGVAKDYALALQWSLKAADQGLAEAQFTAAIIYATDLPGMPRNTMRAYMWADLAVSRFTPDEQDRRDKAANDRDILAAHLTPEHLAAAKRMEADWIAHHPQSP